MTTKSKKTVENLEKALKSDSSKVETAEQLELLIERVKKAQKIYSNYSQEQVDAIFKAAATAAKAAAKTAATSDPATPSAPVRGEGLICVVTAGTADLKVAEEAALTCEFFGARVQRIYDAGVSGLHRLLSQLEPIQAAHCTIAVAGMEGALASVLGGLVSNPVIAVPTSVGYGANFHGLSALLTMLNSCSNGVCTVNIDNGFGAAFLATQINRLACHGGARS